MNRKNISPKSLHNTETGIWLTLLFVFLLSSIFKSVNIHSFALETRLYVDAYMADWLRPLAMTGAIAICVIEMMLALVIILSLRHK